MTCAGAIFLRGKKPKKYPAKLKDFSQYKMFIKIDDRCSKLPSHIHSPVILDNQIGNVVSSDERTLQD